MTTPARRQYLDIKAQHPDALLAIRIGDFYEFFDEDASVAARELQIVLTSRSYGSDLHVPLAGVPVHAIDGYVARLVARGYRVAICDQLSPPGRGLVQRGVTRIVTPGTVFEPSMLPTTRDNYLVALSVARTGSSGDGLAGAGLAYVDVSTGAFACTQWAAADLPDALQAEVQRLRPAEVLVSQAGRLGGSADETESLTWLSEWTCTHWPATDFDVASAHTRLCRHFQTSSLHAFGCADLPHAVAAAGAILAYLEHTHPALLRLLTELRTYSSGSFVEIDGRTWRALEVVEPARSLATGKCTGAAPLTLLGALDATRTPMGARLLRRTLLQPLRERAAIEQRLDAVATFHAHPTLREHVAAALDGTADLERLIARIVHGSATPRELYALAAGLAQAATLARALRHDATPAVQQSGTALNPCATATELIQRAVAHPHEGASRTIRHGYNAELDALEESIREARAWIAGLEATERARTGIKSLKVGFNKVFGYYLDVSKTNLARVPDDYQRRQTLTGGERYVTVALKEREALVLSAEERINTLERTLYAEVLAELAQQHAVMRASAAAMAQLDLWLALAEVALARGYVRPELTDDTTLHIEGGRHPVVEATLEDAQFIPNDTQLDDPHSGPDARRIILLTGPNMAGKSTYLRQVASIVLLAQIGCFVPAERARVGLTDRIFTRVGADDDLARGMSTFMLEMVETAFILRHATARSLVVLDEVGRGTSTTDGLAIAQAVIEHLHAANGARTLFATHFHELSGLAETLPHLHVCRMAIAEHNGAAIFLHRIVPGVSANSYGVQVARMAGLPPSVTARAESLLYQRSPITERHIAEEHIPYRATCPTCGDARLITVDRSTDQHGDGIATSAAASGAHEYVHEHAHEQVTLALASLTVAAMTPMEAINVLFSLQQRALQALQTPTHTAAGGHSI